MDGFDQLYETWLNGQIAAEKNRRRRELLEKGLGHGTVEFLRNVWFPAIGNFDHLYAEWEVRDFHGGYRYLDLAFMPGGAKGGIEIQGYGTHARDLDVKRFKDLCWRHCLLALDGWILLPVAYLSIQDETERCRQLVLAFVGRFISFPVPTGLSSVEAETVRFARRLLRPFSAPELADHLHISDRHARRVLNRMVESGLLHAMGGNRRNRRYQCRFVRT
mgnify:CR=1 FL=1|jgi:hypothetical protein